MLYFVVMGRDILSSELDCTLISFLYERLLEDKNTGKSIIWATNEFEDYGSEYSYNAEISYSSILSLCSKLRGIENVVQKRERVRNKGEVYTPSEICKEMIDYCEEDWFITGGRRLNNDCVSKKDLNDYIDLKWLEIACGNAPFVINTEERIGYLDRKLKAICHYVEDKEEWFKLVCRAYQSSYGYELQGYNLFKARYDLLKTFIECYKDKWNEIPLEKELKKIVDIIVNNFWQMNGVLNTVVTCDSKCKVFDWEKEEWVEIDSFKFDYIVGNPPYQEKKENLNGYISIYDKFMDNAYRMSDRVMLITPARFLFNAGSTVKEWNSKMLNDNHFKVLKYYASSKEVFKGVDIKGGVVIHYRDVNKDFGKIGLFTQFEELNSIYKKVFVHLDKGILSSIMFTQNRYNLDILYKDFPDIQQFIGSNGKEKRLVTSCFVLKDIFHLNKKSEEDIKIIGIVNSNERVENWINRKYIEGHSNLDKYKVLLPGSNSSKAIGEREITSLIGKPMIGYPLVGYTQSFIGIGAFDTLEEAENVMKYIKSKFCRVMLGLLKVTQSNSIDKWKYVPIQDFTAKSDIDWGKSIFEIDKQLYEKYGLNEKEIDFIERRIREMP